MNVFSVLGRGPFLILECVRDTGISNDLHCMLVY